MQLRQNAGCTNGIWNRMLHSSPALPKKNRLQSLLSRDIRIFLNANLQQAPPPLSLWEFLLTA